MLWIGYKSGSGRVFSGFGIWSNYGAGIGKTINILTGYGISLLPGKRDSPKLGTGCGIYVCVSVGNAGNRHDPPVLAIKANQPCQTVRTRTGRQITLSYRALSSYWGTKSFFFLRKPLKTRVNSKYQSKGSTYMFHFLAFVKIRLFNVFFWERKAGFGKLMKNVRNAGFSRKRGRNAGSGPPLPGPW